MSEPGMSNGSAIVLTIFGFFFGVVLGNITVPDGEPERRQRKPKSDAVQQLEACHEACEEGMESFDYVRQLCVCKPTKAKESE